MNPTCRCKEWGSERLSELSTVTQLIGGACGVKPGSVWSHSLYLSLHLARTPEQMYLQVCQALDTWWGGRTHCCSGEPFLELHADCCTPWTQGPIGQIPSPWPFHGHISPLPLTLHGTFGSSFVPCGDFHVLWHKLTKKWHSFCWIIKSRKYSLYKRKWMSKKLKGDLDQQKVQVWPQAELQVTSWDPSLPSSCGSEGRWVGETGPRGCPQLCCFSASPVSVAGASGTWHSRGRAGSICPRYKEKCHVWENERWLC